MSARPFAIAFTVREKFGWSLAALKRLYAHFGVPFTLYLVDCGYPPEVRAELDDFLRGRDNVVIIDSPRPLTPMEAINPVVERMSEEYLYAINNDVLIEPGLGKCALDTFCQTRCALVVPRVLEIQPDGSLGGHFEEETATGIAEQGGALRVQVPVPPPQAPLPPVRRVDHFEAHAVAFTLAAARALSPFPALHSREHIDLAVHAWRLGLPVYVDERAACTFVFPPIRDYDLPFFRFRWDPQATRRSQQEVAKRWNITGFPYTPAFLDNYASFAQPQNVQVVYADTCELDEYPPVFEPPPPGQ